MDTMKARVLHAVGDLRYEDCPMPTLKPDEVLFKVKACGICGSDIPRIFVNRHKGGCFSADSLYEMRKLPQRRLRDV